MPRKTLFNFSKEPLDIPKLWKKYIVPTVGILNSYVLFEKFVYLLFTASPISTTVLNTSATLIKLLLCITGITIDYHK